mmetsp:Transcript_18226/g.43618  ORF Transcript_18226/g.43618 Transcript_18226/m.43618 type:complete len:539 (+) Transcript_18226:107-1723(+)
MPETPEARQGLVPAGPGLQESKVSIEIPSTLPGEAGSSEKAPCQLSGTTFSLPVDSENKAVTLRVCSFERPHMLAFHLSWLSFFVSFFAVFAAAPMTPVIREDLNLTQTSIGTAGVTAVTGTIFCRILMGSICDAFGPRYGHAFLQLGTAPAVFGMAVVRGPLDFILCRFFVGFSLATFVATQFWCSVMFSGRIVGLANATSGGWGNLGGGVTQLLMPLVFSGISRVTERFLAWRWSFFVPGLAMVLMGVFVLVLAQDLPEGQYAELKREGLMRASSNAFSFWAGLRNYRTWILVVTYGFCFGVELTINNLITPYFHDQFDLPLSLAGLLGSTFGFMNLFARAIGGWLSDFSGGRFGMRGRLWAVWLLQTAEGCFCIVLGAVHESLAWTVVLMVLFSVCVQAAEGATFGIVPFVSRRALGVVSGLVGAGGNAGSVLTQTVFFVGGRFTIPEGLMYMGVAIIAVTQLVPLVCFPMWGGMLCSRREGSCEDEYYAADYTDAERRGGAHRAVLKFARESRSERPRRARGDRASPEPEAQGL